MHSTVRNTCSNRHEVHGDQKGLLFCVLNYITEECTVVPVVSLYKQRLQTTNWCWEYICECIKLGTIICCCMPKLMTSAPVFGLVIDSHFCIQAYLSFHSLYLSIYVLNIDQLRISSHSLFNYQHCLCAFSVVAHFTSN